MAQARNKLGVCCLACVVVLYSDVSLRADEQFEDALQRNANSIARMFRVYAKATATFESPTGRASYVSQYWRYDSEVRIHEVGENNQTVDSLIKNGRQFAVRTQKSVDNPFFECGMKITSPDSRQVQIDPWQLCLFQLPTLQRTPPFPVMTLSEAVRACTVNRVSWTSINGNKLLLIELTSKDSSEKHSVWLNPAVNWMISKYVRLGATDVNWKNEYSIVSFDEPEPSLFFPSEVEIQHTMNGQPVHKVTVTITETRINKDSNDYPAPPLPIPQPGIQVLDDLSGTKYWADRDGKPASDPIKLTYGPSFPAPLPDPNSPRQPSEVPVARLFAAVAFLAAICVLFSRRLRARPT